ncbi:MAG TPA: NTP transferase domain-containing protein, partial [Acetobacteraceae bacterium]|nr:NTP transferase domain-containing protein [Acetobacteraceae bacterium]
MDPAPVSGSAASDRPVTVRQCAVLVGGLGSRLGALTARTPKPLLPCGDRPFLAWLLRELLRFGVEECVLL